MRWIAIDSDDWDGHSLHVPVGCANGWITIAHDTVVHYCMSQVYSPASARGIRYNDPTFDFRWLTEPRPISEKDRTFRDFDLGSVKEQ